MTNGEHSWQRMHHASQEALNKTHITDFYPLHQKEAIMLIDGMLQNPGPGMKSSIGECHWSIMLILCQSMNADWEHLQYYLLHMTNA